MIRAAFFCTGLLLLSCSFDRDQMGIEDIIPSLDEMSSVWIHSDTIANLPSLRNFRGQAIVNRDLTSISWLASPPYSGGYHTGVLKINDSIPTADLYRWSVFGTERKTAFEDLEITSSTRLVFDENGVLWKIDFSNPTENDVNLELELDAIGFISRYDIDWQWWYPKPSIRGNQNEIFTDSLLWRFLENLHEVKKVRDNIGLSRDISADWPSDHQILQSDLYSTNVSDGLVTIGDNNSPTVTAYAFNTDHDEISAFKSGSTLKWQLTIPSKETVNFSYVMSFGSDPKIVEEKARRWISDFRQSYYNVKSEWNTKWITLFTPENQFWSGNFPVLETDDRRIRRVYYNSPLTFLYLTHNNLPVMRRVVLTGGPRWGPSIMFYWDTTSWRTIGAVTDPEVMKENLKGWLTIDINKYYGRDYFRGKGVGNGYVANYWAIFQMLHEYLVVTGDYDFLNEVVNEKKILQHMEDMAYNWQNLSKEGQPGYEGDLYNLADFGDDPWLLLEAVPTYIHIVPSFNAGYVGMMRRLSEIYEKLGNEEKAKTIWGDAADMAQRILKLYADDGTWYSLFPNNEKVEIRHSLDFHFIGRYMAEDLTDDTKEEMIAFVENELLTDTWMRAQSLTDPAAENSDRPDHGPLGAYDGWPLNTMEAMYHMGYPEKAIDFYRNIYPATLEGNWAQAHELWGENEKRKNARIRIAERGWHVRDAASGIGFANVMLREFFGFMPKFMDEDILDRPDMPRSIHGKIYNIRYQGNFYTITSDENGLKMKQEMIN